MCENDPIQHSQLEKMVLGLDDHEIRTQCDDDARDALDHFGFRFEPPQYLWVIVIRLCPWRFRIWIMGMSASAFRS
jgi:hypothetical protein